jgi:hypothetical protein
MGKTNILEKTEKSLKKSKNRPLKISKKRRFAFNQEMFSG